MTAPAVDRITAVLDCVQHFGAAVLPIWGVDKDGICDCPKKDKCKSPGKHPCAKLVPNGVNGAQRDSAIIRQWARSYPNANWAMRTGDPFIAGGYLAVVDEDPRNGSEETIAALPDLPETATQMSGGKGRHRVYRFPVSPASRTIGPGIDLQGGGKYIVIAPSRHHTGGFYTWDLGQGPGEIDIPNAPDWLVEGTEESTPRPERDGEATARETVLGELFTLAGRAGPLMPNGQMMVNCPNSDQHGEDRGKGHDTSTVILPPAGGSQFGGIKCLHSSCANLKWHDYLKMMPEHHVKAAQAKYPPKLVSVPKVEPKKDPPPAPPSNPLEECRDKMSWKATKNGYKPISDIVNVITVLTYDPRWKGLLQYDEFSQVLRFTSTPPWHPDDKPKTQSEVWTDDDTNCLDAWLRRYWGIEIHAQKIRDAAYIVGRRESINPLRDWLKSLKWDGVKRIDTWLNTYLGAEDTPFHRSAGRKWLISAVARGVKPGSKADHVLILEGGQGVGKSTALRNLCGPELFSDSKIDIGNKDAYVSLRGKWIIELAELASLSRSENEQLKAFFSSASDSYRPPYGRELVTVPRSCVFAGTTNAGQYLNDETGGRRYWPVKVGVIDQENLAVDRDQIWAEAVQAYASGEQWWPDYSEADLFETTQRGREIADPWEEILSPWANGAGAEKIVHKQGYVTITQIAQFALDIKPSDVTVGFSQRISRVMIHLGWKKDRIMLASRRAVAFRPPVN